MTQEDRELLLKDLCARLPYGVKIFHKVTDETGNTHTYDGYTLHELSNGGQHITLLNYDDKHGVCEVDVECGEFKPYLRPMSSMTEEEKKEWYKESCVDYDCEFQPTPTLALEHCHLSTDWLLKHHFDFRGLIPMGLALEAPEDMYD